MENKSVQPVLERSQDYYLKEKLTERFKVIRNFCQKLVEPLETGGFVIQVMGNTSPAQKHLAQFSWFYETFVPEKMVPGARR